MGVVRRQINKHASRLRREMTDAERALWLELRNRRLLDYKFRSQWSLGPHVADFCCLAGRLVVEVDGSQHNENVDAARTAWLKANGFRVIRFWNNDVLTNMEGVLAVIAEVLEARGKKEKQQEEDPHPSPLPQAGEGAKGTRRQRPSPGVAQ
ncbi:MAG: endonuclease domain-containing protein [Sphingomonadaceae bacterium]|nr:endonuclease domain-containing protein [Sphingomonadaceae bacterium]